MKKLWNSLKGIVLSYTVQYVIMVVGIIIFSLISGNVEYLNDAVMVYEMTIFSAAVTSIPIVIFLLNKYKIKGDKVEVKKLLLMIPLGLCISLFYNMLTISFMTEQVLEINNIILYSTSSLDALGLFRNLASANDRNIKNSVRNLSLTTTSVWASKTNAVGLLAGIIEDFNLYNINIDAEGVIMVGGNVVGGLAGIVRGVFDIDQISSNIGANSTRASTLNNYSIYMSANNQKSTSYNLSQVYYAGSVVGVLDGYSKNMFKVNDERVLNDKRYSVKNISVVGNVTIIGDSIGGAFGLVGEIVSVKNVTIKITGALSGEQYSGGIVGENRGVVEMLMLFLRMIYLFNLVRFLQVLLDLILLVW